MVWGSHRDQDRGSICTLECLYAPSLGKISTTTNFPEICTDSNKHLSMAIGKNLKQFCLFTRVCTGEAGLASRRQSSFTSAKWLKVSRADKFYSIAIQKWELALLLTSTPKNKEPKTNKKPTHNHSIIIDRHWQWMYPDFKTWQLTPDFHETIFYIVSFLPCTRR